MNKALYLEKLPHMPHIDGHLKAHPKNQFQSSAHQKSQKHFAVALVLGIASLLPIGLLPLAPLKAQVAIDFNRQKSNGVISLAASYRMFAQEAGTIIPEHQNSLHLMLGAFLWLTPKLSMRLGVGAGLPVFAPETIEESADSVLFFYEGDFALRFALLKANSAVILMGVLLDASEGHTSIFWAFNPAAQNAYLQAGLGLETEFAFALGLNYLLYLRLNALFLSYNVIRQQKPIWAFYPSQISLELAFLFHKGPSFGLSRAARKIYFGPFYRLEARLLKLLPEVQPILSHTIGFTYYTKPPF